MLLTLDTVRTVPKVVTSLFNKQCNGTTCMLIFLPSSQSHANLCLCFRVMTIQVPLISLTEALRKRLKSDSWGNIIFWLSFCVLGQPMCLILYYHDWLLGNVGMQGIAQAAAEGAGAVASAAADMLTGTCPPAVAAVVS